VQLPEAQVPLQQSLSAEHPLPPGRQHLPLGNVNWHTAAGLQHPTAAPLPPPPAIAQYCPTAAQQAPSWHSPRVHANGPSHVVVTHTLTLGA
jgi:hypothetical protein